MEEKGLNVDVSVAVKKLEVGLKRLVRTRRAGYYPSLFKGKGLEFEGYRRYTYGDDASLIDWKASMRTNSLLVKKFREERDLKVLFIIDVSDKMIFGSTEKLKCEYIAELAASLSYVILKAGDRVGFSFFTDEVREYSSPKGGLTTFYTFLKRLKNPQTYGGKSNLKAVLQSLHTSINKDLVPIIISDFLGPIDWSRELRVLSQKVETIGIKVDDPRDYSLPDDVKEVTLQDPNTGRTLLVDVSLVKDKYEEYAKKHKKIVEKVFRDARVDLLNLDTSEGFIEPVISFFKRRKQWK